MENNHLKYKLLSMTDAVFHFIVSILTTLHSIRNVVFTLNTMKPRLEEKYLEFCSFIFVATSNCKMLKFTNSSFDCFILKSPNKGKKTISNTFSPKKFFHCCIKSMKNKWSTSQHKKKNYTCSSQTHNNNTLKEKVQKLKL